MSLLRMNYHSQLLGKYVDLSIVFPTDKMCLPSNLEIPPAHSPVPSPDSFELHPGIQFQTIYLMHGGGDDDTLPYRYTNIERYAQEHCVMIVTPDISNSFGIDTAYGVAYQSFLSKELPLLIQSLFPSSPRREDNFIMGYAMGGNVAIGTALLHPELFSYCVDLSGGIGMTLDMDLLDTELVSDHFTNHFPLYPASFGEREFYSQYDLKKAAIQAMKSHPTPVTIICGSDEFIRERLENDARILHEIGYPPNISVRKDMHTISLCGGLSPLFPGKNPSL